MDPRGLRASDGSPHVRLCDQNGIYTYHDRRRVSGPPPASCRHRVALRDRFHFDFVRLGDEFGWPSALAAFRRSVIADVPRRRRERLDARARRRAADPHTREFRGLPRAARGAHGGAVGAAARPCGP